VAIVQALRALYQQAQNNDDCQILVCIISCILACIQSIIEYLNRWAFIYVGTPLFFTLLFAGTLGDCASDVLLLIYRSLWIQFS